jgi:hypothetical protein
MSKGKNKAKELVDWLVEKVLGSSNRAHKGPLSPVPVPVRN